MKETCKECNFGRRGWKRAHPAHDKVAVLGGQLSSVGFDELAGEGHDESGGAVCVSCQFHVSKLLVQQAEGSGVTFVKAPMNSVPGLGLAVQAEVMASRDVGGGKELLREPNRCNQARGTHAAHRV